MKQINKITVARWRIRFVLGLVGLIGLSGCAGSGANILTPQMSVVAMRPLGFSGNHSQMEIDLLISNPNTFTLPIKTVAFSAQSAHDGQAFAEGLTPAVNVPGGGEKKIRVTIDTPEQPKLEELQKIALGATTSTTADKPVLSGVAHIAHRKRPVLELETR